MSTSEEFAFHVVVDALDAVAAAPGRKAKVALLAECLASTPDPLVPAVVGWLAGSPRQRRTGVGWAALRDLAEVVPALPGSTPLTASEVDDAFERWQAQAGAGSTAQRGADVATLLSRATRAEAAVLRVLIAGGARTGAAAGLVLDAVVLACGAPADVVRRAAMLLGDPAQALLVARRDGEAGLRAVGLQLGVPLAPMLAASAASVGEALAKAGPAAVEWKLDGVRVQVHRDGDSVRLFTRTLDEITDRLPDVTAEVAALPVRRLVADGEVLAFDGAGRPEPFQVTSARVARRRRRPGSEPVRLVLFDLLHVDGRDLWEEDGPTRRHALESAVGGATADLAAPGVHVVPRLEVSVEDAGAEAAESFAEAALTAGHEGVLVKALAGGYAMGRRGAGWIKVKPRLTLDLVVVAAEWGHGRRTGLLSNLHLAALDPDGRFGPPGATVMLGKTFKGLDDRTLAWQTQRFLELATDDDGWVVHVRPEQVVEIAFDGVQRSSRYPGGVALRFARVVRYREDKTAAEADTIGAVQSHLAPG